MSQQLISRNADLKRLRDEGYDIQIKSGHLIMKNVPYVTSKKEVQFGTLVSALSLAGDVTTTPGTHVIHFAGDYPCNNDGSPIEQIRNESGRKTLAPGLEIQHSFSSKPRGGYTDHYEKMVAYCRILSGPARSFDAKLTAQPFPVIETSEEESPFIYFDTASSRAGIAMVNRKLEQIGKIAIVGLGGTGSYVLDLVAKTPVKEIHLFDGDYFLNHNAFRAPGAASLEELRKQLKKVAYLQAKYANMRRNIIPHDCYIDASNVDQLLGMDFVFLCLDGGGIKCPIIEMLEKSGTSFIDVGMGIELVDESLLGVLRITTSTPNMRDHVHVKNRIPLSDAVDNNDYARNIQIADLNAMNAALAVIKWKKLVGFYRDLNCEHFSLYSVVANSVINEDQP